MPPIKQYHYSKRFCRIRSVNFNDVMWMDKYIQNRFLILMRPYLLFSQQCCSWLCYYYDVLMSTMASQITSLTIIYSTVYSGADQRKHQSSVSLSFVRGIHRWPGNSPYKGPVTRKMFPFDAVIMHHLQLSRHPQAMVTMCGSYIYKVMRQGLISN